MYLWSAIAAWGLWAGYVLAAVILSRPRAASVARRNLLIFAAHSDDCVIVGGEYAHHVAAAGGDIGVVYMTAGSDRPGDARSSQRRAEAIAAWSLAGVPEESLRFLDAVQTELGETNRHDAGELERLREAMRDSLASAPPDTTVLIPAAFEDHDDHVLMRDLVREVFAGIGRDDLSLIEAPEYNKYLSMTQSPLRVLVLTALAIPFVERVSGLSRAAFADARFVSGPVGAEFTDPESLAFKRRQLEAFTSENPDQLLHFFGGRTRYRDLGADLPDRPDPWWTLFGCRAGLGVIVYFGLLLLALHLSGWVLAGSLDLPAVPAWGTTLILGGLGVAAFRRSRPEFLAMWLAILAAFPLQSMPWP